MIFDLSYLTRFISLFLSSLRLGLLWYPCQFCFIVKNDSYVAFVFETKEKDIYVIELFKIFNLDFHEVF